MTDYSQYTAEINEVIKQETQRTLQQNASLQQATNVASNVKSLMEDYPWLTPGTAYALAGSNLTGESANIVAQAELRQQVEKNPDKFERYARQNLNRRQRRALRAFEDMGWGDSPFEGVLRSGIRGVFTGFQAGQDLVSSRLRTYATGVENAPWWLDWIPNEPIIGLPLKSELTVALGYADENKAYAKAREQGQKAVGGGILGEIAGAVNTTFAPTIEQNTLGQVMLAAEAGRPIDLGSGFFPDPEGKIMKAQAEAAREYSPYLIGGSAWTPGRALAGELFDPDTTPFTVLSGFTDAAVALALDPSAPLFSWVGKGGRAARTLETAENIAAREGRAFGGQANLVRAYEEGRISYETLEEVGMMGARRRWTDPRNALSFLYSSTGDNLVNQIAAQDSATRIWWEGFNKKIPFEIAQDLAETSDPSQVRIILADVFGTEIRQVPRWRNGTQLNRWLIDLPETAIDPENLDASLRNIEGALITAKVPEEKIVSTLDNYANLAGRSGGDYYEAVKGVFGVLRDQLVDGYGVDRELADQLTTFLNRSFDDASNYWRSAMDGSQVTPEVLIGGQTVRAPSPLSEMDRLGRGVTLPDPRELRKVVNELDFISRVKGARSVEAAGWLGDFLVSGVWKPMVLLRPAWTIRVVGEEMLRIAVGGSGGIFRHPLSYLSVVVANDDANRFTQYVAELVDRNAPLRQAVLSYYDNIAGELTPEEANFVRELVEGAPLERWTRFKEQFGRVASDVTGNLQADDEEGLGAATSDVFAGLYEGGSRTRVPGAFDATRTYDNVPVIGPDGTQTTVRQATSRGVDGLIEEVMRFSSDSNVRRLLFDFDGNVEAFYAWGLTDEGGEARRIISAGRREATGPNPDPWALVETDDDVWRQWANTLHDRIMDFSQGNDEIIQAMRRGVAQPRLPGERAIRLTDAGRQSTRAGREWAARIIETSEQAPEYVKAYRTVSLANGEPGQRWLNTAVRGLFDALGAKPTNYLNRSPEFRIRYWQEIEQLASSLDNPSRSELLRNLGAIEGSENAVGRLMPGQRERLNQILTDNNVGGLSLADADRIAKKRSLDHVQSLLYDLSKRNQAFDAMRLVFPFGEAWKEVLTTWARLGRDYPQIFPRFYQMWTGAKESEFDPTTGLPTGEGIGFIHWDSQTEQEVFTYPGSKFFSQALTGIPIPMTGSVQGLNMIGNGIPSVGPAISIPVSFFLPNKPQYDSIRDLLFPYGTPEDRTDVLAIGLPAWARRLRSVIEGPQNDRVYMNTVTDVAAYLNSTGEYDIQGSNAREEMVRLFVDAKEKAKWLYLVRAAAQTTLPSAPQLKFMAEDPNGNLIAMRAIVDDYQKMKKKARKEGRPNADAFDEFLNKWGVDNVLLTSSKSQRNVPGLTSTVEQRDWERANSDLTKKYPDVWALFAPEGTKYDSTAYNAQLRSGQRVALTTDEIIRRTNDRLASHLYNRGREALLNEPLTTPQRQQRLRNLKDALRREYPGYEQTAFARDSAALIVQLEQALSEPVFADTQTGRALSEYFAVRARAQGTVSRAGLSWPPTSDRAALVRDGLLRVGQALAQKYPNFARTWDEVLESEIMVK